MPDQIKLTVYKVPGEINTDDLSSGTFVVTVSRASDMLMIGTTKLVVQ